MKLFFSILLCISYSSFGQVTINFQTESTGKNISIDVFKFYITHINLQFEDGSTYTEPSSYHLINQEITSSEHILIDDAPNKPIVGLNFIIGTDSITNVSGALSGDLDPINGMYWAWNTGYINFKLEGNQSVDKFEYHIGGYLQPYPTARQVQLNSKSPIHDEVNITVDPTDFLEATSEIESRSVLIPGKLAYQLADIYQSIFRLDE